MSREVVVSIEEPRFTWIDISGPEPGELEAIAAFKDKVSVFSGFRGALANARLLLDVNRRGGRDLPAAGPILPFHSRAPPAA